ncbi:MAG TPA: hypothetical protein VGG20_05940, partial [Thermoanaerobaculia bacterium]
MSRRALGFLLVAGLLAATARPAAAQEHPNTARGFNAGFGGGDVDSVNPFNGNLVIHIPIGQAYKVNGHLGYQLSLIYNNNVWDYQKRDDMTTGQTYTQAIPNRTANAGLGWTVSLGRLNPPTSLDVDTSRPAYLSPDGALHTFYPTLHEGDATVSGVQFTRDGTYLRYKAATSEIEFPDGTVHHFNAAGFPDQIHDRFTNQGAFTNQIGIDYTNPSLWAISDGFRIQKVWFRNVLGFQVVDRIELTAFGTGIPATWKFRYNTDDAIPYQVIGCKNTDPLNPQTVPLLTQVLLPDGSTYKMAAADYGTQFNPPCDAGMLKGMT